MKNSIFTVIISVLFLSILFSCKTLKQKKAIVDGMTADLLYDSVMKHQFDFETLSAKFTVKYKAAKNSMSLKGNMRILKDSVIWISLSPGFGIEAARLICTKDSVFLINRLKKEIIKANYNFTAKKFNLKVDYNSLESILTNRFFMYPKSEDIKKSFDNEFRYSIDNESIIIDKISKDAIANLIKISRRSFLISSCSIKDMKNNRSLNVGYVAGNFEGVKPFPSDVRITSKAGSKSLLADLHYKKVALNKAMKISYNLPRTYKVIRGENIKK